MSKITVIGNISLFQSPLTGKRGNQYKITFVVF